MSLEEAFWQKTYERNYARGYARGYVMGSMAIQKYAAWNMLNSGKSVEEVASLLEMPEEVVRALTVEPGLIPA